MYITFEERMNRYLLFSGTFRDRYFGIFNLKGDYSSLQSAKNACDFENKECEEDWAHVFDIKTRAVISVGQYDKGWEDTKVSLRQIIA